MRKFIYIAILLFAFFAPLYSFNLPQARERKTSFVSDFLNVNEHKQSAAVGLPESAFAIKRTENLQADFNFSEKIFVKKNPSKAFSSGFT